MVLSLYKDAQFLVLQLTSCTQHSARLEKVLKNVAQLNLLFLEKIFFDQQLYTGSSSTTQRPVTSPL